MDDSKKRIACPICGDFINKTSIDVHVNQCLDNQGTGNQLSDSSDQTASSASINQLTNVKKTKPSLEVDVKLAQSQTESADEAFSPVDAWKKLMVAGKGAPGSAAGTSI